MQLPCLVVTRVRTLFNLPSPTLLARGCFGFVFLCSNKRNTSAKRTHRNKVKTALHQRGICFRNVLLFTRPNSVGITTKSWDKTKSPLDDSDI